MKRDRFLRTDLDHEVAEIQGYLGLGMKPQSLAAARRLLRRPTLTAQAFREAVDAILIQGDNLKRWQPWIEAAYDRLPSALRKQVRFQMLSFYVAREDWHAAEHHVPAKSDNPIELLFAMWTLLELRRDRAARRIYQQCRQFWSTATIPRDQVADFEMEISANIEAIACYCAHRGNWDEAAAWWWKGTTVRPFTPNAWDGLVKLQALEALSITLRALESAEERDWFFADETFLQLPHAAAQPRRQAEKRRFEKYESHLSRVIPDNERFRFNATLL
jgi:tetratricopeptide (TPR) repeat protein